MDRDAQTGCLERSTRKEQSMKGKILLTAVGMLAVLGVAAVLSRRTHERESFDSDGDRGNPQPVSDDMSANLGSEDTSATLAMDEQ